MLQAVAGKPPGATSPRLLLTPGTPYFKFKTEMPKDGEVDGLQDCWRIFGSLLASGHAITCMFFPAGCHGPIWQDALKTRPTCIFLVTADFLPREILWPSNEGARSGNEELKR